LYQYFDVATNTAQLLVWLLLLLLASASGDAAERRMLTVNSKVKLRWQCIMQQVDVGN
jgi:hypothetical protein